MYDIAILTTAIIRPEIHVRSFSSLKKFITKNIKILWIINLDFVNVFNNIYPNIEITDKIIDQSLFNTAITIKYLFKHYNNIEFKFIYNRKGNFNIAVRNLLKEVSPILNNIKYGILYLEDDWLIVKNTHKISHYLIELENNNTSILGYRFGFGTCIGNRASFRPSIWSKKSFKELFIEAFQKNQRLDIDPESILITFYNNFKTSKKFICLPNELMVSDIGRNWIKSKHLIKWNRKDIDSNKIEYGNQ